MDKIGYKYLNLKIKIFIIWQDDESVYDLTQDNESIYDLTQDNESSYDLSQENENVYKSTQDSDLIQGASLDTGENYNEVDLFYENETVEYENIWD